MEKSYEQAYHQLEDTQWWFVARRDMLLGLTPRESAILEVGCASGAFLNSLKADKFTHLLGIDVSEEAIMRAHARGLNNVSMADARHIPFEDSRFDIVVSSDVLEHIENDSEALREWHRVLKPGGKLLLFVPAHPFLWSSHDEANQHIRRYQRVEILRMLAGAGFAIERSSYWNVFMFFPIAFIRALLHILPNKLMQRGRQLHALPRVFNTIIIGILRFENLLIVRGWRVPLGVSFFAVARKTDERRTA